MSIKLKTILTLTLFLSATAYAQEEQAQQAPEPAPVPAANEQAAVDELQQAYQKEYAFLESQLRDLRARTNEFTTSSQQNIAAREAAIDRLEGEYIQLQSRGERINDLLTEADRQAQAVEDNRDVLEATFLQSSTTLEPYQIEVIGSEQYLAANDIDKLNTLFSESTSLLSDLGKIRRETGAFFLPDGTEVNGTIIRLGNVAAYGVSPQGSGVLAPAGENRLKMWSEDAEEVAQAFNRNQQPASMQVFLFESLNKAIDEKEGKTVLGVIASGGTIAWLIVGLGILALILIVLRFLFLRSASASTGKVVKDVGQLVQKNQLAKALEVCKRMKGATSRVVAAAIRNLDRDREHLEDIVSEAILHESSHLNRFGSFILVIAAVAPLLGLLGTVTGMISTFDVITEFGTGDPKLLSGGISIALVTTEVGLAVAIPTLLLGNLLSGWAEGIKDDMEKAALRVINVYQDGARGEVEA